MTGWKQWDSLELVTHTEFQSYLQDQVVQVYAGTAARGSALGTAVSAGMVAYLTDTSVLQFYNGTAWANVSQIGDITGVTAGTALTGGGTSGDVTLNVNLAAVGSAVLASPNVTGTAVLPTATSIGSVSSLEISYLDGVTSGIQSQIDSKAGTAHTHTFSTLTDFAVSSPQNGQTFAYSTATGKWTNAAAVATGETISSFLLMGA